MIYKKITDGNSQKINPTANLETMSTQSDPDPFLFWSTLKYASLL